MSYYTKSEREEARENIADLLPPGTTVYTILRHVARSGMSRTIAPLVLPEGQPRWIGYSAARVLGDRYDTNAEGIAVSGAGMDMGFHLVYSLSAALFPDGFACIGADCPSADHSNGAPRPHDYDSPSGLCTVYHCGLVREDHPTSPAHHRDGGYALRQRWL